MLTHPQLVGEEGIATGGDTFENMSMFRRGASSGLKFGIGGNVSNDVSI